MNRRSLYIIVPLLGFSLSAPAGTEDYAVQVKKLMDTYHRAVVDHDGAQLAALFIPEGATWLNVLSDAAYARARAKSPEAAKVRVGSFKDFAAFVSSSKLSIDPRHSHLRIFSDGTIATAYFDFEFMIDGKVENRGSETWQLVKGPEGWRIAAITYSSDPPAP